MPPLLTWFAVRDVVARFVDGNLLVEPGRLGAVHTYANAQDALAVYQRGRDGIDHAHAIIVLTVRVAPSPPDKILACGECNPAQLPVC